MAIETLPLDYKILITHYNKKIIIVSNIKNNSTNCNSSRLINQICGRYDAFPTPVNGKA